MDDLWDQWMDIPDYAGDDAPYGWGVYGTACERCGHQWIVVAPVGSRGRECPRCGDWHPNWLWHKDLKELP